MQKQKFNISSRVVLAGLAAMFVLPVGLFSQDSLAADTTYHLMYDANGGYATIIPPNQTGIVSGKEIVLATNPKPLRQGKEFECWAISAPATTCITDQKVTFVTNDITVYAKWNSVATKYTVTYNANQQSSGNAPIDNASAGRELSETVVVAGPDNLNKDGFYFGGWKSSADEKTYNQGDTFYMPKQNVTLTAVWISGSAPAADGGQGAGSTDSSATGSGVSPTVKPLVPDAGFIGALLKNPIVVALSGISGVAVVSFLLRKKISA